MFDDIDNCAIFAKILKERGYRLYDENFKFFLKNNKGMKYEDVFKKYANSYFNLIPAPRASRFDDDNFIIPVLTLMIYINPFNKRKNKEYYITINSFSVHVTDTSLIDDPKKILCEYAEGFRSSSSYYCDTIAISSILQAFITLNIAEDFFFRKDMRFPGTVYSKINTINQYA